MARLKLTAVHLLLLVLAVSVIFESVIAKKVVKKPKDDEDEGEGGGDKEKGGDKETGGEDEKENAAGKKMQEALTKLLDSWKNFKMPDAFGAPSFLDMHNCLSHSMNKGMKAHPDIGQNLVNFYVKRYKTPFL